ncbi:superinfection immunity protein [Burkholderia ubonensis]|uniref:superinfection immunity protein n=1 Tax=Burkholderia ubonensis TaxID=101571 RepID=UPI00075AD132|nr:superinfection immunity protein [Burkholderia ubonensis]KVZ02984.1 hypothetical protein WL11_16780 [Burkholderia ubonensis]
MELIEILKHLLAGGATIGVIFAMYFAPSIVAYKADHPDYRAIVTTNILVGWTGIGWICAMIWAQKR